MVILNGLPISGGTASDALLKYGGNQDKALVRNDPPINQEGNSWLTRIEMSVPIHEFS
jgi:hypothetical protein